MCWCWHKDDYLPLLAARRGCAGRPLRFAREEGNLGAFDGCGARTGVFGAFAIEKYNNNRVSIPNISYIANCLIFLYTDDICLSLFHKLNKSQHCPALN